MLPPKCISCGKFMADIQLTYEQMLSDIEADTSLNQEQQKNKMKECLDKLYIKRWCCRAQVISYKDLINIVI